MGINNGYIGGNGTIWSTSCDDNSIRIFYMEAKQIHTRNSNERVRPRLQEVGRYYRQIDRPAKESTNGTNKT